MPLGLPACRCQVARCFWGCGVENQSCKRIGFANVAVVWAITGYKVQPASSGSSAALDDMMNST